MGLENDALQRISPSSMRALVCCALLCSGWLAFAAEPAEKLAARGVAEFKAGYDAWDATRFAAAADLFREAIAAEPNTVAFHYWLGVAEFHRMLQLETQPQTRESRNIAESARERALSAVTAATKLDEAQAESHALAATLYGMKIDGNWFRAAQFGPRLQEHRRKAMKSGAEDPRVQYLLGTCQFHTARGAAGQREALESFLRAQRLFEAEAGHEPAALEPRWGYSSCLTFIGRTYEALGQNQDAETYFRKALDRHSADHLAREGLARVTANK